MKCSEFLLGIRMECFGGYRRKIEQKTTLLVRSPMAPVTLSRRLEKAIVYLPPGKKRELRKVDILAVLASGRRGAGASFAEERGFLSVLFYG